MWFYTNKEAFNSWNACSNAFLTMYFLVGKTNALRNRICSFQQLQDETVLEAWELFYEYIAACQHHHMEEWLIIQNFFHGLSQ
jgi:deoxyadenosine/deoxycytidine kinase